MTTVMESEMMFVRPARGMSEIRLSCGWKYNRTLYYDSRQVVFEGSKCCDHCPHCLSHQVALGKALTQAGLPHTFLTDLETLTLWVSVERPLGLDPVEFFRQ